MAAQLTTTIDERHESEDRDQGERRNWFHLTKGFKRHAGWRTLTPSHRIVFYTILDIANEMWFPDTIQLYEAEIAHESATSTRSVKRALADLRKAGVLHFGTVEEDGDRRTAVRIRVDYDALTRLGRRQNAESRRFKSAFCRLNGEKTQLECGSTSTQVQLQKEQQDCPRRTTVISEVGGELRDGDLCPKCGTHRLTARFKTNAVSRTKERFLACSGYQSGGCRGFTWNLGATAYQPSRRVLSQALVGALHVPGRPALVRDVLATAAPVDEQPVSTTNTAPLTLGDWFHKSRYLPVELMLDTLATVAADLAARHRDRADKNAILRDVKARIAEDVR